MLQKNRTPRLGLVVASDAVGDAMEGEDVAVAGPHFVRLHGVPMGADQHRLKR